MTNMEKLEARIRRLEDVEGIRILKARYAHLCDQKYSIREADETKLDQIATEIATLFTVDAVWDGGVRFGIARGRKAIFERFRKKSFRFAYHYFVMPHISVNGNEATGIWYLFQPATTNADTAIWISGAERDEYRRTCDGWLMSQLVLDLAFIAPFDEGWAQNRFID